MDLIALGNSEDIDNGAAKEFILTQFTPAVEMFVVRKNNHFYAYLNRCPHTGANLNWQPDQFFDFYHEYIQCCLHGALFKVESGYCVRGPCAGMSLRAADIVINDGTLYFKGKPNAS